MTHLVHGLFKQVRAASFIVILGEVHGGNTALLFIDRRGRLFRSTGHTSTERSLHPTDQGHTYATRPPHTHHHSPFITAIPSARLFNKKFYLICCEDVDHRGTTVEQRDQPGLVAAPSPEEHGLLDHWS